MISKSFPFLESRLDVILYRSNLFRSIFSAKQYIAHKKVYVNGDLVNKPGYRLKIDDIVNLSDVSFFYEDLKTRLQNNKILGNYPSYLYINYKLGTIKLLRLPQPATVPFPFFMNIEQMSHNFSK